MQIHNVLNYTSSKEATAPVRNKGKNQTLLFKRTQRGNMS